MQITIPACRLRFLTLLILVFGSITVFGQNEPKLTDCRLQGWKESVKCGQLEVFENRQKAAGRKITLKFVVVPATGGEKLKDPVFYLAGGPGGSAVEALSGMGAAFLARIREQRDLVFIDQRGTGGSNPLKCNLYTDGQQMAPYFSEVFSLQRLAECRSRLEKDADLSQYTTSNAVADFDDVRKYLGYEKINLYGASYGTTSAMFYMRQFPANVRSAVLMGVAPPDFKLPLKVPRAVQHALDLLFEDCASDARCKAAFPELKADFQKVAAQLDKGNVTFNTSNPFNGRVESVTMSRAGFNEHIRSMLYSPQTARWMPLAIHLAAEGEFSLFGTVAYQTFKQREDAIARGMHFSVVCAEDVPFITEKEVAAAGQGTSYGLQRIRAYQDACKIWPATPANKRVLDPVKSNIPTLVVSGELDPVTPPFYAEEILPGLSNSRHVVIRNTGHAFSYACVDKMVDAFVQSGSSKNIDVSCLAEIKRPEWLTPEDLDKMLASQRAAMAPKPPAGATTEQWDGVLDVGSARLKLVLNLSKKSDGTYFASLDSPDQGATGLKIDTVVVSGENIRFEMKQLFAGYEGKLKDGKMTGTWSQGGNSWPLSFTLRPTK